MLKSICALAKMPCPKTGDTSAKCYCPAWVTGIPETERDGSGRLIATITYTGCLIPKLLPYMAGVTAEADHAHAAANQARDAALEVRDSLHVAERSMRAVLLPPLMESLGLSDGTERVAIAERSETQ